jgi:eukaryotic-like serine/threonine-protein kinase
MGSVWVAEDMQLGRRVALKFLSVELASDQNALERFKFEARTASSLNHPNICTIHEIGEADGEYFIAMELVEGEPLDRYLVRHPPDAQELLDVAIQIADALEAAHSKGILHRDIKPANILITARGQAKILDFGLAKLISAGRAAEQPTYIGAASGTVPEHLTSPGMAVGTTAFMSPEQARGKELDARSDLFSFGAVLYDMATGKLPFDGPTAAVIFDGILNRNPVPPLELNPGLPAKLDDIIRTALEKDRDLRYQSAAEMRAELKRLKRDTSSGRVPVASSASVSVPKRRNKIYVLVAALVLIVAAAGAYVWLNRARGFNLQNMKLVQVTNSGNAGAGALSPDGRYIVYALQDGARESLWIQQLATGSNIQILPPDQAHFVAVSFTPDGNYVMFVRSDKSTLNFRYLYQMPVLGGGPREILRDIDSAPAFSPDGQRFAFARGILHPPGNDILIANSDGGDERVVAHFDGFGPGNAQVAWSADGQNLATISPETRSGGSQWIMKLISAKNGAVKELHSFSLPAQALAWLPDGSGILTIGTDSQSGRGQIWLVSYPKGEVSRFVNDLTNYDLCCLHVTHEGNSLVVLQDTAFSDVWVGKPDGSDARQITSGEAVGFGLNWIGDRLAAGTPRGKWFVMNSDGSSKTSLTSDNDPHFQVSSCKDGKHIVYWDLHNGQFELWSANADGTNPLKLVPVTLIGSDICGPDSKSVLYVRDGAVWSIPIEGGTPEKTNFPFAQLGFSPDGQSFFQISQKVEGGSLHARLIVSAVSGGSPERVFEVPYGMQSPQFTPDGKGIAFMITRNRATNIWKQPLDSKDLVQITKFPTGEMFAFAWSQDGKQLAVARGMRTTDVVMMSNFR